MTNIKCTDILQDLPHTLSFKEKAFFLDKVIGIKNYGEEKVQIETKDMKKTEIENLEILRISGNVSSILKN